MLGAIIGDMVGSPYEFNAGAKPKKEDIKLFGEGNKMTDDSYLTLAVGKVLMRHYPFDLTASFKEAIQRELKEEFKKAVLAHPYAGFGASFQKWASLPYEEMAPYNSCANGSAMRVSSLGWLCSSLSEVKELSLIVSEITHNHPDGIKGAEAIAACVYLARNSFSKEQIRDYVELNYYPSIRSLDYEDLVRNYAFDVFCENSCPQAIYCFLQSESLEDAIIKAVCIGGDSDTIASMAGAIAEAFYSKNGLSELERRYMDGVLDKETIEPIKKMHRLIKSPKFAS